MAKEKLYDFVDPADGECVRREAIIIVQKFFPDYDSSLFSQALRTWRAVFGRYSGYRRAIPVS